MQYSPRRLLAALGLSAIIAVASVGCSANEKSTPNTLPTPAVRCQQPLTYRDTLSSGQGYEFFQGEKTSSRVQRIQYRGGNSFAFLDDSGNVVTPEEARQYSNPDGSVRFIKGGEFNFVGNVFGTDDSFRITIAFEDFEDNKAKISVSTSKCTRLRTY